MSAISPHPTELTGKYLYLGSLGAHESQYKGGKFVGLTLRATHAREISHDLYTPLPCPASVIQKAQAQDVFEHLDYASLPGIMDDVYRVLMPGGVFRVSVPDYRSPVLRQRCVFDEQGNVLADLMMGGTVVFDPKAGRSVKFAPGGNSHIWFPTFETVQALILRSELRRCAVRFYHYWIDAVRYQCEPIPDPEMQVARAPPRDMRAGGKPVSIVVDFIK